MTDGLLIQESFLEDLVFALKTSLNRVTEGDLHAPAAKLHWRTVQQWLTQADEVLQHKEAPDQTVRLKPFPISGAQLHALQVAVDAAIKHRTNPKGAIVSASEAERLHALRIASPPATPRMRLHRGLLQLHVSSIALALLLGLILLLNVVDLFVLHLAYHYVSLGVNLAAGLLALVIWLIHEWHLRGHIDLVRQMHPHPFR